MFDWKGNRRDHRAGLRGGQESWGTSRADPSELWNLSSDPAAPPNWDQLALKGPDQSFLSHSTITEGWRQQEQTESLINPPRLTWLSPAGPQSSCLTLVLMRLMRQTCHCNGMSPGWLLKLRCVSTRCLVSVQLRPFPSREWFQTMHVNVRTLLQH